MQAVNRPLNEEALDYSRSLSRHLQVSHFELRDARVLAAAARNRRDRLLRDRKVHSALGVLLLCFGFYLGKVLPDFGGNEVQKQPTAQLPKAVQPVAVPAQVTVTPQPVNEVKIPVEITKPLIPVAPALVAAATAPIAKPIAPVIPVTAQTSRQAAKPIVPQTKINTGKPIGTAQQSDPAKSGDVAAVVPVKSIIASTPSDKAVTAVEVPLQPSPSAVAIPKATEKQPGYTLVGVPVDGVAQIKLTGSTAIKHVKVGEKLPDNTVLKKANAETGEISN
jgi:hypothetical protein